MDVCQLWFGRLAGCGYPVIEPTPIVDGFRVGHHSLVFGLGGGLRRGTRLIGADSLPRMSNPRFPSASRAFDVALPDRRASFSSLVSSMPTLWHGEIRHETPRTTTVPMIDEVAHEKSIR